AKAQRKSPAVLAAEIAASFAPSQWLASATATGPFVNFRAARPAAFRWVVTAALTDQLLPRALGAGQTICIDYSSPNISKSLAYHHIRSTVIGHSLVQIFRALGYRTVGINHLGDWGTTHGMLIAGAKLWPEALPEPVDVAALGALYQRYRKEMETDPKLEDLARQWFGRLERGDAEARAMWQRFRDISWAEFETVYQQLGITFDEVRGESAYEAAMPGVLEEMAQKGLSKESEGALVIELPGEKAPLLLKTKDGTTLYATRDLAAAQYRWTTYHFTRSLYVVDRGQALHFRQLFAALGLAGHEWASRCEHVPFGLVRLGGKKTGTRAGNVVLLKEVFADATDDVTPRIAENQAQLPPEQVAETARMVGIGAVVFANLVTQREKDVDFTWEKVVSLDGDSGPYLQYSHARCASILRKAGWTSSNVEAAAEAEQLDFSRLAHDAEWAVARRLLDFPEIVARAAQSCEPHGICHYLLDLAGDFSRWYTAGNGDATLRVLCDDEDTRRVRLMLTAAVRATMARGLGLLGMGAPDAM
ncbi:MAG TPA: arginine--tRNA ligase, partial [Kofleriaceae bacterium]|nr:arginine--tRNA ligase [Kofleriaceae bacterium]